MIRPLADNILLQFIPEDTVSPGGIHVPGNIKANRRGVRKAEVLAVGPGHYRNNGFGPFIPTTVKPGDVVLTTEMAGEDYSLDNYTPRQNVGVEFGRHRVVREDELLAVFE